MVGRLRAKWISAFSEKAVSKRTYRLLLQTAMFIGQCVMWNWSKGYYLKAGGQVLCFGSDSVDARQLQLLDFLRRSSLITWEIVPCVRCLAMTCWRQTRPTASSWHNSIRLTKLPFDAKLVREQSKQTMSMFRSVQADMTLSLQDSGKSMWASPHKHHGSPVSKGCAAISCKFGIFWHMLLLMYAQCWAQLLVDSVDMSSPCLCNLFQVPRRDWWGWNAPGEHRHASGGTEVRRCWIYTRVVVDFLTCWCAVLDSRHL